MNTLLPSLEIDLAASQLFQAALIRDGVHGLVLMGTVGEGNSLSAQEKHSVLAGAPGRPSRHLDVDVARGRPVWMDLREILNFRLGQWSVAALLIALSRILPHQAGTPAISRMKLVPSNRPRCQAHQGD